VSKSKKERIDELKAKFREIVKEHDLTGLTLFVALSPNDRDDGDQDIPIFYVASQDHNNVAALVGWSFADFVGHHEKTSGNYSSEVRVILADTIVTSMRHAFHAIDQVRGMATKGHENPEQAYEYAEKEEETEFQKSFFRLNGTILSSIKKAGNA
jgi:hypothetical protein